MILGTCNWVSKVGQVTGRYRASASRNAFSGGPRIHWSVNTVASVRLLCNDVNCKHLPEGPHPGAERCGAIVRVGTESRPKEVKAARQVAEERRKSRRVGSVGARGGGDEWRPGVFKNTPKWSTPLRASGNKREPSGNPLRVHATTRAESFLCSRSSSLDWQGFNNPRAPSFLSVCGKEIGRSKDSTRNYPEFHSRDKLRE